MKIVSFDHDGIKIHVEIEDRLVKPMPDRQQTWIKMMGIQKAQQLMSALTDDLNMCLGIGYHDFLMKANGKQTEEKEEGEK